MANDGEPTPTPILPILEDIDDSDLSLDPSLPDSHDDDSDDDAGMSEPDDPPYRVCERCGADDEELVEWGDDCYVCILCHACQLCGASEPELVDHGDGLFICIHCYEKARSDTCLDSKASNDEAVDGDNPADNANHARQHTAAQLAFTGNPVNPDPEATQWGVQIHVDATGPTDFGFMEHDA